MKIFATSQFTPLKTLKKTAKIAAMTLPLMIGAQSCSPWLFPPPPPDPYHYPHPRPRPHRHPNRHPHFHLFGAVQPQDTIQSDVFELSKNDMAYFDNTKQNK